jgi:hypothetical protein
MVYAEKGGLLHSSGHAMGRGSSSLAIFGGTDMNYRFKKTKELGEGDKGMHSSTVQSLVWSGWSNDF